MNVLWLTMDHVTFRHYRLNKGARPILNTYERLADAGVSFSGCKSTHPLCLPARASMLTGMYTHRHGLLRNEHGFATPYVPAVTALRDAGYQMGYFGKNHSGLEDLSQFGFEGFYPPEYGNPYHTPAYRAYLDRLGLPDPIVRHEWGTDGRFAPGDYNIVRADYFNNYSCGVFQTEGPYHEADFLLDLSVRWLRERAAAGEPFVLRMDTWGPHHAYQIPKGFADTLYRPEDIAPIPGWDVERIQGKPPFVQAFLEQTRQRGGGAVDAWAQWQHILMRAYENYAYIDMRLGSLLDELERLGLRGSTAVLLTADHGDAAATHGGMFDKCGDMAEELMDIPMVISAPGLPRGQVVDGFVSNLDVTATILDFAGVPSPYPMDSESLCGFALQGHGRDVQLCEHYGHFENRFVQRAIYEGDWKYIVTEDNMDQLYNLAEDPYELRNVAGEAAEARARMRTLLEGELRKHADSPYIMQYGQ